MSDPEIARRCLQCGATVRARAQFCPQCGCPVREGDVVRAGNASSGASRAMDERPRPKAVVAVRDDAKRRLGEERVARVKERSRVVLDEAAVDPSVRFVLVACLLFAIFIVVLLLNLAFN